MTNAQTHNDFRLMDSSGNLATSGQAGADELAASATGTPATSTTSAATDEAINLVLDELFNLGIVGQRAEANGSQFVEIPSSGARIPVDDLAVRLAAAPPAARSGIVSEFVWNAMSEGESFEAASLSDLDLSLGIRTILLPADEEVRAELSYGRPVGDGLVEALAVEHRGKVAVLRDADLAALGRDAAQLFEDGQTRVNMEVVQSTPVWGSVRVVESDGMFAAARVLDMPALLASLELDAPRGALVVPLNQQVILLATPAPADAVETLQATAQLARSIATSQQAPLAGGIITTDVYFWHPGGALEKAAFWRNDDPAAADPEGGSGLQLVLDPGPEFVAEMTRA